MLFSTNFYLQTTLFKNVVNERFFYSKVVDNICLLFFLNTHKLCDRNIYRCREVCKLKPFLRYLLLFFGLFFLIHNLLLNHHKYCDRNIYGDLCFCVIKYLDG